VDVFSCSLHHAVEEELMSLRGALARRKALRTCSAAPRRRGRAAAGMPSYTDVIGTTPSRSSCLRCAAGSAWLHHGVDVELGFGPDSVDCTCCRRMSNGRTEHINVPLQFFLLRQEDLVPKSEYGRLGARIGKLEHETRIGSWIFPLTSNTRVTRLK
jgi:hypothetical protein